MRKPGIQIMLNRKENKVWIASGYDIYSILKTKASMLNKHISNNDSGGYKIPVNLKADMDNKKANVFDDVYVLTFDSKNRNKAMQKKLLNALKSYCRYNLCKEKEIYGTEDWYIGNKHLAELSEKDIEDNIKIDNIRIYKITDMQKFMEKEFLYEKITLKDFKEELKCAKEVIDMKENNTEDDIVIEEIKDINKILEIEAVLRGCKNKEELLKSIISDKAYEIYNVFHK